MGTIILVTGGARSGKSRFAEQYVARVGRHIGYIATAEVYDEEDNLLTVGLCEYVRIESKPIL